RMILMAANTLSRSKRPVAVTLAVTQRSSARYRHWPFRCCSSPVTVLAARLLPAPLAVQVHPNADAQSTNDVATAVIARRSAIMEQPAVRSNSSGLGHAVGIRS